MARSQSVVISCARGTALVVVFLLVGNFIPGADLQPAIVLGGGHNSAVLSVAYSADGKRMLTTGWADGIKVWDTETGRLQSSRINSLGGVVESAFFPTNDLVATATLDGYVMVWNRDSGQGKVAFQAKMDHVLAFALHPDGNTVAIAGRQGKRSEGTVRLADLSMNKETAVIASDLSEESTVIRLGFNPAGNMLAMGTRGGVTRLWSLTENKELFALRSANSPIQALAFSPDGKLLAVGARDATLTLWEVASGERKAVLKGHAVAIVAVAFDKTGAFLASAALNTDQPATGQVKIWDVASAKEIASLASNNVRDVAFHPAGNKLTLAAGTYARLWDWRNEKNQPTVLTPQSVARAVAVQPDGAVMATGGAFFTPSDIHFWDAASGKALETIPAAQFGEVRSLAYSPDGKLLASGHGGGKLLIWELARREIIASLEHGQSWPITSLAFNRAGTLLATAASDTARLWKVDGKETREIPLGSIIPALSVEFSRNGEILLISGEREIVVWDLTQKKKMVTFPATPNIRAAVFAPDEKSVLFARSDNTIHRGDIASGMSTLLQGIPKMDIETIRFGPDGKTLAIGGKLNTGGVAYLWDLSRGQALAALRGTPRELLSIVWVSKHRIASTSFGANVVMWDLPEEK